VFPLQWLYAATSHRRALALGGFIRWFLEIQAVSNVSLVIVSHSLDVARGTADMVRQMAGDSVAVAFCGGAPGGGLGSDPQRIRDCIEQVWNEAGVVVLADLGGAGMNAEMAREMLNARLRGRVHICDAPIVEGAVMAATEASIGGDLRAVCQAAMEVQGG